MRSTSVVWPHLLLFARTLGNNVPQPARHLNENRVAAPLDQQSARRTSLGWQLAVQETIAPF